MEISYRRSRNILYDFELFLQKKKRAFRRILVFKVCQLFGKCTQRNYLNHSILRVPLAPPLIPVANPVALCRFHCFGSRRRHLYLGTAVASWSPSYAGSSGVHSSTQQSEWPFADVNLIVPLSRLKSYSGSHSNQVKIHFTRIYRDPTWSSPSHPLPSFLLTIMLQLQSKIILLSQILHVLFFLPGNTSSSFSLCFLYPFFRL